MVSGIRNFVVTFFLFLVVFGIIGHFVVNDVVPALIEGDSEESLPEESGDGNVSDTSESESVSVPESSEAVSGNSYTFAFICLGLEEELVGVYLTHVNDGYETCVSAILPGTAKTEITGSTLAQIYRLKGKEFLIEKIRYLTGLKVDDCATLHSVDTNGTGRSITELSNYLDYRYRINTAFEYPNPLYKPEAPEDSGEVSEESGESSEESVDSGEDITKKEFITIPAGSYSLKGITEGIQNYRLLLDPKYNPEAHSICQELLTQMLADTSMVGNSSKQATVMNFFKDLSFSKYESSDAAKYLFNSFDKETFVCNGGAGAEWDVAKDHFKTLEKGNK